MPSCLPPYHRRSPFFWKAALVLVCLCWGPVTVSIGFEIPRVEFAPRRYVCTRTTGPVTIDGKLDEQAWQFAAWTSEFVDIEGSGPRDPGAAMIVNESGEVAGSVSGGCVEGAVVGEALAILDGQREPGVVTFGYSDDEAFAVGLTCGGTIHLFIEELDW